MASRRFQFAKPQPQEEDDVAIQTTRALGPGTVAPAAINTALSGSQSNINTNTNNNNNTNSNNKATSPAILESSNQGSIYDAYVSAASEASQIGIRHFANPIFLLRRKKHGHGLAAQSLNEVIDNLRVLNEREYNYYESKYQLNRRNNHSRSRTKTRMRDKILQKRNFEQCLCKDDNVTLRSQKRRANMGNGFSLDRLAYERNEKEKFETERLEPAFKRQRTLCRRQFRVESLNLRKKNYFEFYRESPYCEPELDVIINDRNNNNSNKNSNKNKNKKSIHNFYRNSGNNNSNQNNNDNSNFNGGGGRRKGKCTINYVLWKFNTVDSSAKTRKGVKRLNNSEIIFRIDCRCSLCMVNCRNVYELQKHVLSWHDGLTFKFKFVWTNKGKSSEYIRTSDYITFNLIFIDIWPMPSRIIINSFALDYKNKLKQRDDFLNGNINDNDNDNNNNNNKKKKQTEDSMYHGWCNIWSNIDLNDNLNLMDKKAIIFHYFIKPMQSHLLSLSDNPNINNPHANYKFYDPGELPPPTIKFDTQTFMKQLQMLYRSKWNYHKQICMTLYSPQIFFDSKSTFTLSKDRFRHRNVRALTNEEKLLICEEVLLYPRMNSRVNKVAKHLGLSSNKIRKLMSIYPILLMLNDCEINKQRTKRWYKWKTYKMVQFSVRDKTDVITNDDLAKYTLKHFVSNIAVTYPKGIHDLTFFEKLWFCEFILKHNGRSFIPKLYNHISGQQHIISHLDKKLVDFEEHLLPKLTMYSIYNNYCVYLLLLKRPIVLSQLKKWWKDEERVFNPPSTNTTMINATNKGKKDKKRGRRRGNNNLSAPARKGQIYASNKTFEELFPEDKQKSKNSKNKNKYSRKSENKNRRYRNNQNKENKNKHGKDKLLIRPGTANRLKSSQIKSKTTPAKVACETKLLLIMDIVIKETKTKESVAETFHLKPRTVYRWIKGVKRLLIKYENEKNCNENIFIQNGIELQKDNENQPNAESSAKNDNTSNTDDVVIKSEPNIDDITDPTAIAQALLKEAGIDTRDIAMDKSSSKNKGKENREDKIVKQKINESKIEFKYRVLLEKVNEWLKQARAKARSRRKKSHRSHRRRAHHHKKKKRRKVANMQGKQYLSQFRRFMDERSDISEASDVVSDEEYDPTSERGHGKKKKKRSRDSVGKAGDLIHDDPKQRGKYLKMLPKMSELSKYQSKYEMRYKQRKKDKNVATRELLYVTRVFLFFYVCSFLFENILFFFLQYSDYNGGFYHGSTFARVPYEVANGDINVNVGTKHDDKENNENGRQVMVGSMVDQDSLATVSPPQGTLSDTDLDVDDRWMIEWERRMLYEFDDISYGDKRIMQLWNEYMRQEASDENKSMDRYSIRGKGCFAIYLLPAKLIHFTLLFQKIIAKENLFLPFLFHCINLWEFGLIEPKCIQECMTMLYAHAAPNSD